MSSMSGNTFAHSRLNQTQSFRQGRARSKEGQTKLFHRHMNVRPMTNSGRRYDEAGVHVNVEGIDALKEYLVTSAYATGRRNWLSRHDESMSTGQIHNQIHIDTTLNGPK